MFRQHILQFCFIITTLFCHYCHASESSRDMMLESIPDISTLTPPNGSLSLDITQMGTLQLGISHWNGLPLNVRNYAQSRVSVLSGEKDTIIAYLDRQGYMNVILFSAEIKYRCMFGQSVRSSLLISMYADTFTVINHNNCELSVMNQHDESLYDVLVA